MPQPSAEGFPAAPQGPSSYYQFNANAGTASNSGFEEPPATAQPCDLAYLQNS